MTYIKPTMKQLRHVAFIDMLRGPANKTYGGCDGAFLLRDKTGSTIALISINTRGTYWSESYSLARNIAERCGHEPFTGITVDLEKNGDLKERVKRFPEINSVTFMGMPEKFMRNYASGAPGESKWKPKPLPFADGQRVAVKPHADLFMKGVRYGTVKRCKFEKTTIEDDHGRTRTVATDLLESIPETTIQPGSMQDAHA